MTSTFVNKFINRPRETMRQQILQSLVNKGPCPATILAYRAEMNDRQLQHALAFLIDRKMVVRTPLTDKLRMKMDNKFSLSSRDLINITPKGSKYLEMLNKLDNQIDWSKFQQDKSWRNKKR